MRFVHIGAGLYCLAALLSSAGCSRAHVERVCWNVMGTVAAVQTKGDPDGAKRVFAETKAVFGRIETLLNVHDPDSEINALSRLRDSDAVKSCTEEVRPCYEAAFMLRKATEGAFDPRWRGNGTLDFGAIAKGFAVDRACEVLSASGSTGMPCLLDLGGNLKSVRGEWKVGVRDPRGKGFAATVVLREGEALATSATYFRGRHIRDGRTGEVVSNGVASVTVLCDSAMLADGLSTALFVLGPEKGGCLPEKTGSFAGGKISVFWITDDGRSFGDARFEKR